MTSARMRGTISTSIGIEAHDPQGVDLLPHLHGADLGREGGAGAAGDHDRGEEDAQLAQDQDADEVDDEGRARRTLTSWKMPCCDDDAADQERDQHDDRHAPIGDLLELVDHGRAAEAAGMEDDPHEGGDELAQEADAADDVLAGPGDALADIDEEIDQRGNAAASARPGTAVGDLVQKDLLLRASHWRNRDLCPWRDSSCRVRSRVQAPRVSSRSTPPRSMITGQRSASAAIASATGSRPSAACWRRPGAGQPDRTRLPSARSIVACGS